MNVSELLQLLAQRGNDRAAIATALRLTPQQIDELQRECVRLADERSPYPTPGGPIFNARELA